MRFTTALKRNALPILIVAAAVALVVYMTQRSEGFQTTIKIEDCERRGKTEDGSYTWKNGVCWAPCGAGKKMRNYDTCGPLDNRFTSDRTRYKPGSSDYIRFYKPELFTKREKAYY